MRWKKFISNVVIVGMMGSILGSGVPVLAQSYLYKQQASISKKSNHVFKISPNSSRYENRLSAWAYDEYALVRSYVDELANRGGGMLILQKGTYRISKPIYISSNIKIILENGVVIKKTFDEKVPSQSIFQFVDRDRIIQMQEVAGSGSLIEKIKRIKKSDKKLLYTQYNGVRNSAIIGKGKVVIDLQNEKDAQAIVVGHNRNIEISGITFKNSYNNHFIEVDATDTIKIHNCVFQNAKVSEGTNKEAINLDTPDLVTKGFNCFWSSQDKTPNRNVTIEACKFINLERGIGTHQFSHMKYHTNINILNCSFNKVSVPVFGINWKNIRIEGNQMQNIRKIGNSYDGNSIFLAGIEKVTIRDNQINHFERPNIREEYNVSQQYYPATSSVITQEEKEMIESCNQYGKK